MKQLPDKCVDLTVTSPPYDNLRDYNGYSFNFEDISRELFRITTDGGVVVWVVKDSIINGSKSLTSFNQAIQFKQIGFNIYDVIIYAKNSVNYPTPRRYYDCFEYMFVLSRNRPNIVNLIKDRKNYWVGSPSNTGTCRQQDGTKKPRCESFKKDIEPYGVRHNIWKYQTGFNLSTTDKKAFEHPAIFPEQLAKDHILSWSNIGCLVLDPFAGSGTTLKMAELLDRKWIGIEISSEYCKIAENRIKEAKEQHALFNQ